MQLTRLSGKDTVILQAYIESRSWSCLLPGLKFPWVRGLIRILCYPHSLSPPVRTLWSNWDKWCFVPLPLQKRIPRIHCYTLTLMGRRHAFPSASFNIYFTSYTLTKLWINYTKLLHDILMKWIYVKLGILVHSPWSKRCLELKVSISLYSLSRISYANCLRGIIPQWTLFGHLENPACNGKTMKRYTIITVSKHL